MSFCGLRFPRIDDLDTAPLEVQHISGGDRRTAGFGGCCYLSVSLRDRTPCASTLDDDLRIDNGRGTIERDNLLPKLFGKHRFQAVTQR